MGRLEVFRGNINGAKQPRNVTSHVGLPRNVTGENMISPKKGTKMSKNQPKLKVILHAFRVFQSPSSEHHGMPPRAIGGHWKGVMWLGINIWMSLRSFRGNFRFHEK